MLRRLLFILVFSFLVAPLASAGEKEEALLTAVRKGDAAAVKSLLAQGADANAKYRYGRTVLSFAADRGNTEIVKMLLEAGADPGAKDTFYQASPMDMASSKGHVEVIKLLIEKGAKGKEDALVEGAGNGNLALVNMILETGGIKPEDLTRALSAAERGKHTEVVEALKKTGALPAPKPAFQVDEATLKSYAGSYKSETGPELTFAWKEGKLVGGPAGQSFTLGAFDRVTFGLLEVDGVRITFKLEAEKVVGMHLRQGNFEANYKKAEEKQ